MSFVAPRIMAWSYSRLKTWEECPLKAKLKFVNRLKEADSIYAARGIEIHKQAEAYLKDPLAPLPSTLSGVAKYLEQFRTPEHQPIIQTELQMALTKYWGPIDWFNPNVYVRVVYDLYRKLRGHVSIRDHKTGKIREEEHDDQLDLYATSAFGLDETVEEVDVGIIYVDHAKETKKIYKRVQFVERKKYWDERAAPMLADDLFSPRPGSYCRYCHFRKTNGGPCQFG